MGVGCFRTRNNGKLKEEKESKNFTIVAKRVKGPQEEVEGRGEE